MKQLIFSIFFSLITIILFGQNSSNKNLRYKPKTLDEAIAQLEKIYDDTTKHNIIAMTEEEFLGKSHFGIGMWMRNNWGLWKGKELAKHFNSLGIFHPDDMSAIILKSYHRQLKGQDRKLDEQIKYYQDYWKKSKEHFNKLKTDTNYQRRDREIRDSLALDGLKREKSMWTKDKVVSGYLKYQCGFFDLGKMTQVKGIILRWDDEKLVIKITMYFDERKRQSVIKCNKIIDDIAVIEDYRNFRLEK